MQLESRCVQTLIVHPPAPAAVQEFSEDMGSAASKFGSSLLASLAFSKFKSSSTLAQQQKQEQQPGGLQDAGDEGTSTAAAAATAAAEAAGAAAAEEEEAARQLTANASAPALGGGTGDSFLADAAAGEAALSFGVLAERSAELAAARPGYGALSAEASGAALSPLPQLQPHPQAHQQGGALSPRGGAPHKHGNAGGGIARVADGLAAAGEKTAQGRLDFVMQVRKPCRTRCSML